MRIQTAPGAPRKRPSRAAAWRWLSGALSLALLAACGPRDTPDRPAALQGNPDRGRALAAAYGCGSCHYVQGAPWARGFVGPPLDRIGERAYLGGVVPNTAPGMIAWLRFPQQADPGTAMPDLGLSEAEARDIAAYLYTL